MKAFTLYDRYITDPDSSSSGPHASGNAQPHRVSVYDVTNVRVTSWDDLGDELTEVVARVYGESPTEALQCAREWAISHRYEPVCEFDLVRDASRRDASR